MREDWIGTFLGEICKFSQGIQVPKEEQFLETFDKCTRFLRIIDFTQDNEPIRYISYSEGIHNVEPEDISMVRYGTVGFVCTGKKGAIANNLFRIIPIISINNSFLILYLNSELFKSQLNSKGATMQALSFGMISPIKVPLPPLPEQRAIVKKLESLLSSLDAGVADLKKAQQQLKIYRQAVLKKAFEGGNEVKLSSCCIKAEKVNRRNIELESSLKYIDIGSIDNKLNKIIGFKEYLWKDAPSRAQQIIKNGDILFSTVRTYLRNIAQVESDIYENEICSSGFTVLRADDTKLLNKYLFHFTLYNGFLDKLGELQTGTSYPAVRDKDVFDQLIPLPSIEQQNEIVKQIESRLSVCDSIEQNIKEGLEKAEALRQSILKKAFEGNLLTAQELAECKMAEDYKPASVLLKKIKADKIKK